LIRTISTWFQRGASQPPVALGFGQERILLVRGQPDPVFEQEACNGQADWPRALQSLFSRTQLTGSPVRVLLPANLFQQVQIEKPEVPDDELAGALPWAVKDFVNESVLQLSFDYYELPTNPAARPRLAVVCVPKIRMQLIAQGVNAVAVLQSVSTEELALADLLGQKEQMQLLLYQVPGQDVSLLAVHRGQLCFSRQLRGFAQLAEQAISNLNPDMLDNLSLEIQRSLDYLVSQLKLPEAAHLHVAIAAPDLGGLVRHLAGNFSMPVSALANPAIAAGIEYLPLYGVLQAEVEA
jgi:MSHA biogenesis protein MshI